MPTIQCHCGAVKVSLERAPIARFYCHCDHSQRGHGAAYVMHRADQVKVVAGEPSTWKLHTLRATCRDCGARIFAEPAGFGMRGVMAKLLPEGLFEPPFHVHCQHALLPVKDSLPHFKGFPAGFGGSNQVVDW